MADLLSPSFDDAMIHAAQLPYLEEEPPHEFELLTVRDAMSLPLPLPLTLTLPLPPTLTPTLALTLTLAGAVAPMPHRTEAAGR